MKKIILGLLCISGLIALPGCWCRRSCEPCEPVCQERCYDECDMPCDRYDGKHYHNDDVWGYEEQQGYRKPIYKKSRKKEVVTKSRVMHKPVHPEVIAAAEARGDEITYLDPRYGKQNKRLMNEAAMAENGKIVPMASDNDDIAYIK